jgi:hypothetical protein
MNNELEAQVRLGRNKRQKKDLLKRVFYPGGGIREKHGQFCHFG